MRIDEIISINTRDYVGPEERGYDFSLLNSVSTCPFYGILRHVKEKSFENNERAMALECGALCHHCYEAYRALSIYYRGKNENKPILVTIGYNYLCNLFKTVILGIDDVKAKELVDNSFTKAEESVTLLSKYTVFSDCLIDNSDYYDDPDDKKRTIVNIKASLLAYLSNFLEIILTEPVWIENEEDVNSKIGIEVPFNLNIDIKYNQEGKECTKTYHFIGKLDGIHTKDGSLVIHENKTASRLDDSWSGQWYKSHQITGYCLAASYFTGVQCYQARVLGMQIPVPKYSGYSFRSERVDRTTDMFSDWARWLITTVDLIDSYKDTPEIAPMNTHACCKYYRQCSFMPICMAETSDRKRIIEEEMVESKWSPLDE